VGTQLGGCASSTKAALNAYRLLSLGTINHDFKSNTKKGSPARSLLAGRDTKMEAAWIMHVESSFPHMGEQFLSSCGARTAADPFDRDC
jgi:hypothetical protein